MAYQYRTRNPASSTSLQNSQQFLDPFLSVNPCCCCCGVIPIINGIKSLATISMVISAIYLILGCWFSFNALLIDNTQVGLETTEAQTENLMNILLICGLTSLIGGTLRFLTSLYLLKTAEKESKTPAKFWCIITFGIIMISTSIILAFSQKDESVFNSLVLELYLFHCFIDFVLLLYFLWVIIVFVKEEIDMPGL